MRLSISSSLGLFNYSSMTSNIILAPSLKLFWNSKQSVIVWNSLTQSVYRENNSFCSSVMLARSFSSFLQINSNSFLYSLQEDVSYSVGSSAANPESAQNPLFLTRFPLTRTDFLFDEKCSYFAHMRRFTAVKRMQMREIWAFIGNRTIFVGA